MIYAGTNAAFWETARILERVKEKAREKFCAASVGIIEQKSGSLGDKVWWNLFNY